MADPPGLAAYLKALRQHESGSNYSARGHPGRSASGAYQYIDATWGGYGGYQHASDAPQSVQDARARADAIANYHAYGSWDAVATVHFTGHVVTPGSAEWNRRPPGPSDNPTPAEYVASIHRLMGSASAASTGNVDDPTAKASRSGTRAGFTKSQQQMGGFGDGISAWHTPGTESAGQMPVTGAGPNVNEAGADWWDLPMMDPSSFKNTVLRNAPSSNQGGVSGRVFDEAFDPGHGGGGDFGRQIAQIGKKYVGVPYVWGGTSASGLDCSGLVQYVFGQAGIKLPRLSADQARSGPNFNPALARAGDLIAWDNSSRNNGADHIAISLGNGYILEAPHTGLNVRVRKLTQTDLREAWAVRVKGDVRDDIKGTPPLLAASKKLAGSGGTPTPPRSTAKRAPARPSALSRSATATGRSVGKTAASAVRTGVKKAAPKKATSTPNWTKPVAAKGRSVGSNAASAVAAGARKAPQKAPAKKSYGRTWSHPGD